MWPSFSPSSPYPICLTLYLIVGKNRKLQRWGRMGGEQERRPPASASWPAAAATGVTASITGRMPRCWTLENLPGSAVGEEESRIELEYIECIQSGALIYYGNK